MWQLCCNRGCAIEKSLKHASICLVAFVQYLLLSANYGGFDGGGTLILFFSCGVGGVGKCSDTGGCCG